MDDFPQGLLRTDEVAAYLRVSPTVVTSWIRAGKLPAFRLVGRYRIKSADLLAFLNRGA